MHNFRRMSGATNDNFRKNICSEDDLRSRIFVTFVVKFLTCLPLLGFSNISFLPRLERPLLAGKFLTDFDTKKGHLEFSGFFSWLKFSGRKIFIPIIFGSLDFQLGNPNR